MSPLCLRRRTISGHTRVGYDEVSSLVIEGAVGGAGRVPRARQALVAKVHSVAVVQQSLSDLKQNQKLTVWKSEALWIPQTSA